MYAFSKEQVDAILGALNRLGAVDGYPIVRMIDGVMLQTHAMADARAQALRDLQAKGVIDVPAETANGAEEHAGAHVS